MSAKYTCSEHVPLHILTDRIRSIVGSIKRGEAVHLSMRVPAEVDDDADLVMSELVRRVEWQAGEIERLASKLYEPSPYVTHNAINKVVENDLDKCETQLKQACQAVEVAIDEYIGNYELYGEDDTGRSGCYTPTEQEIMLIEDAIQGLLSDTDFVTSFNLWQDLIKMHTSA